MIDYLAQIEEELMLITDYDHYLEEAHKSLEKAFNDVYDSGLTLSMHRKSCAKKLQKEVITEL